MKTIDERVMQKTTTKKKDKDRKEQGNRSYSKTVRAK